MNPEGGSLFVQYAFPMVMVAAIFYFIVLIPSKRQQRKVQDFLENLKENDRVVTTGGIYGQISRINGDRVQLQVADKVRIEVARASIGGYQGQPPVTEANS